MVALTTLASSEPESQLPLRRRMHQEVRPVSTTSPRKTTRLRDLIQGPHLSFLMEAHNGLSARIAEEAGFPGVWASGLSISASLGVRDNNEDSWTQVVDVVELMGDANRVPILIDGETDFHNFILVRWLK